MPKVRRKTRNRTGWTSHHLDQLVSGIVFYPDPFNGDEAAVREAWNALKVQAFAEARRQRGQIMPRAWWLYDAKEARDDTVTEQEQLDRMGIDPAEVGR